MRSLLKWPQGLVSLLSSVKKREKTHKLLFVFLGLLVLVLIVEAVYLLQLKQNEKVSEMPGSSPTIVEQSCPADGETEPDMVAPQEETVLVSPVKKDYLKESFIDEKYSQVMSFSLPPGEPIGAVFAGRVTQVLEDQKPFSDDSSFDEIRLKRTDEQFWVSYVIVGEVLVQEGQEVEQGDVLAKAGEGGLEFRSGANLSFWLHNENNQMIKLSREMFAL